MGNLTYSEGNVVEMHIINDIMQSVKPWAASLVDNDYKVLLYSGQLDIIVAAPLTESFVQSVDWKNSKKYKTAQRLVYHIDQEVAGYVRIVENFIQLIIRNGGHILPYDQPKWSYDMITKFVKNKSFFK